MTGAILRGWGIAGTKAPSVPDLLQHKPDTHPSKFAHAGDQPDVGELTPGCNRARAAEFGRNQRMTLEQFSRSLDNAEPPVATLALQALWYDAKGDWGRAHDVLQNGDGTDDCWVHAFLHRKEGDKANAGYWYRRAGKLVASGPLDTEWAAIVTALLSQESTVQ